MPAPHPDTLPTMNDMSRPPHEHAPLSYSQQQLWFLQQYEPGLTAYNLTRAFRLTGALDRAALSAALDALQARHAILRTRFAEIDGLPYQQAVPPFPVQLAWLDLRQLPPQQREQRLQEELQAAAAHVFDLGQAGQLDVRLIALGPQEHVLVIGMHHIVSDAWSNPLVIRDLAEAYRQARRDGQVQLPALPMQYADYAHWQRQRVQGAWLADELRYWDDYLGPVNSSLDLPTDRPRPARQSFRGAVHAFTLDSALAQQMQAFCRAQHCTPFVALMAAWQVLLSRYSGQADFLVGAPNAGRNHAELQDLVGFFVTTQLYRARLTPELTVRELVRQVRGDMLAALEHGDLPFEALLEHRKVERDPGRNPLFQVMFGLQMVGEGATALAFDDIVTAPVPLAQDSAKFDLSLDVKVIKGEVHCRLEYASDLFDAATIAAMAGHYQNLLRGFAAAPERPVAQLALLDQDEQARLRSWGDPQLREALPPTPGASLAGLIEAQAAAIPDAVAVVCGPQQMSYAQLNRAANRLAHRLLQQGVGPEDRIGLAAPRSLEMIVGLLAILKAGAAYVPLDPDYPADRLAYMVQDAGVTLALTAGEGVSALTAQGLRTLEIAPALADDAAPAHNPGVVLHPDNLAYIIYTSGSTGRPKGAQLSHANVLRLLGQTAAWFDFGREDVWTLFHSYAFDFSVWEIFGALCYGGRLVVVPFAVSRSPEDFLALLVEQRVTVLNQTPSAFRQLLQLPALRQLPSEALALRTVIFGGEALEPEMLRPWITQFGDQRPALINMYGITETTVHVTYRRLLRADLDASRSPIGAAIPDLGLYVLDQRLNLAPAGVPGELYVSGAGLARGYLNRAALSAERFVANPFARAGEEGSRLYRTGDLVRWRHDGQMDYLGRIDQQVKIRGFRIELGEIEAQLLAQPGVGAATVMVRQDAATPRLVGYLSPQAGIAPEALDTGALRTALGAVLPDYMVPAALVVLPALPLNINGKVDRKALPVPELAARTAYAAPQGALEEQLAAIWREVLKGGAVGRDDNFFELGGDSILSLQIVSRARRAGIAITARQMFERQTVAELAAVASEAVAAATPRAIAQTAQAGQACRLLPIQQDFFEADIPRRTHWNQSVLLHSDAPIDPAALAAALHALMQAHPALTMRYAQHSDGWRQLHGELPTLQAIAERIVSARAADAEQLLALCESAQRSLDLEHGLVLRAVLVDMGQAGWRLLLVAHHLVIDGVSWRVLLEDLQHAYAHACATPEQPLQLPAEEAGLAEWGEALAAYAPVAAQRIDHWLGLAGCPVQLPSDPARAGEEGASACLADQQSVLLRLTPALTQTLIGEAHSAWRTQVNDLLLAALARALAAWGASQLLLVDLEGHGREALGDGAATPDLSRTVGWFTSVFPLALEASGTPLATLLRTKESLRALPNKGLDFGVLRRFGTAEQRDALQALPRAQVAFNYLGQFQSGEEGGWRLASESAGTPMDPQAAMRHALTINGQVHEGVLQLRLNYCSKRYGRAMVETLAAHLQTQLEELAALCSQHAGGLTPSDLPLAGLDQAQLDALPLAARNVDDIYPLSPMQAGMLFHSVFEPGGSAYINQLRVDIDGLDAARFEQAWQDTVAAHDILRTGFLHQPRPLQWVARRVASPLSQLDWRDAAAGQSLGGELDALAQRQLAQGFDLAAPPLMRLVLVRTGAQRHHLIWTVHHLLLDGWSTSMLLGEVLRRYAQAAAAGQAKPTKLALRYRDYIGWLQGRDQEATRRFWEIQLARLQQPTRLADAMPRPSTAQSGHGEHRELLDAALTARLNEAARAQRITLNTLVQAAWALLLQRYTYAAHDQGVVFGATVAGRPAELTGVEQLLGLFINTLPVIVATPPQQPAGDWMRALQAQNLQAREYEHTPLVDIQRWSGQGAQALFDSILVFENYPVDATLSQGAPAGLAFSSVRHREETNYPMTVVVNAGDTLQLQLRYARAQFAHEMVERIGAHLRHLLQVLAEHPQQAIGSLGLLPGDELAAWRESGVNRELHAFDAPVHRLIERQAAATPSAAALLYEDLVLDYRSLNQQANRLAHRLLAEGAGPERIVGVAARRAPEMVVALLAVLKAGAAYLPLDPDLPPARLADMMADSGLSLLLTQTALRAELTAPAAVRVLELDAPGQPWAEGMPDHDPGIEVAPDGLAYVIYTSGSTGKPKGAGNRHVSLHNRLAWMQEAYPIGPGNTVLQKTPFGFDVSVWEFFWPLMTGARLALAAPDEHRDPALLAARIRRHAVDTLHFVPSMLQAFVAHPDSAQCHSLRQVICSGEALPAELQEQAFARLPQIALHNLYGPTEAAIDVTHWTCRPGERSVPIGRPISHTAAYVLDGGLNPLPHGIAGELYLGGIGLARGYLGRPGLSAERFVADPFAADGSRMYRTGDLVRRRADGEIEYLGRTDHQVKIRGLRIELGEIEAQLLAQPGVAAAVVVALVEPGRPARLVGYAADPGATLEAEALRAALLQSLPDYMVPQRLILLPALPLNANGKVDRKALPRPDFNEQGGYEAPQGQTEIGLAAIWAEVLRLQRVGRHDNFFELGGDSILSLQIVARAHEQGWPLTPRQLFQSQTVAELAQQCDQLQPPAPTQAVTAARGRLEDYLSAAQTAQLALQGELEDVYPLSPMQQGMLFHTMESPGSGLYVNQLSVRVEGLDEARFAQAWQSVLARHPVMRTGFLWQAGYAQPLQAVWRTLAFGIEVQDWSARADDADLPQAIAAFAAADLARGFDLLQPPLVRATLLRLGPGQHQLVWTMHHILLDGWSTSALMQELMLAYGGQPLPAPGPDYAQYIGWLATLDPQAAQRYWMGALQALDGPSLLAEGVRPDPARRGFSKLYGHCDAAATRRLEQFARSQRVTLNTLVQGAWSLALARHKRSTAVAFGATVSGRPAALAGVEKSLGLFINTIPIVVEVDGQRRVGDWLRTLQQTNIDSREHEHTPLYDIQRWSGMAGRALFDSIIVFENFPISRSLEARAQAGLRFGQAEGEGLTGFAMDLQVVARETLDIEFCYDRSLFGDAEVEALREQVMLNLDALSASGERALGELARLSPQALAAMLELGRGTHDYPADLPAHLLIAQRAAQTPDAIALVLEEQSLSYGELNGRANRLAHHLISLGVGAEQRVGVAVERSFDMVVGLLAVMKAGAAYVPLDLDYPPERLAYMVADSRIRVLLTHARARQLLAAQAQPGLRCLALDDAGLAAQLAGLPAHDPVVAVAPQQMAYVIYTSGSTGQPKGVAVSHGPLVMHCQATAALYEMTPQWRELQFMSFSFDGAHERWITTLISGAALVLRGPEMWSIEQSWQALHQQRVSNAVFPPAYLGQLAQWGEQHGDAPPLELYVFGGEAMPRASFERVRRHLAPRLLINGYGPTETVVTPLIWKGTSAAGVDFDGPFVPIGKPVGRRNAYILDACLQPVAPGEAGELYIGGDGLARGYLERPAQSAERFVADPFGEPGARMYRTGDLARWLPDGNVEYLGRLDHQVKIRGFRIELGEIEALLRRQPGVAEAAVVVRSDGQGEETVRQLVAYVGAPQAVAAPEAAQRDFSDSLRAALRAGLPEYMLPAHFVLLAALPVTHNGKLDRKALPAPQAAPARSYVAPATPAAQALAEIWQTVLKRERVGQEDNFFELGGDSLLCLQVIARARGQRQWNFNFKLADLMQRPTIAALLGLESRPADGPALVAMNAGPQDVAPLFCLHAGMGTVFDYRPLAQALQGRRRVYGLPCAMLQDPAQAAPTLAQLADHYTAQLRSVQPQGPYHLLGWSLGATLAAQVAQRLEAQGAQVAFLGLVDGYVPQSEAADARDWLDDLQDFVSVMLPASWDGAAGSKRWLALQALQARQSGALPSEAAALAMLSAMLEQAGELPASLPSVGELARIFVVARHLRQISAQAPALEAVAASPHYWWIARRKPAHRAELKRQLGQTGCAEVQLETDHFSIMKQARLLDEVVQALEVLAGDCAGVAGAAMGRSS